MKEHCIYNDFISNNLISNYSGSGIGGVAKKGIGNMMMYEFAVKVIGKNKRDLFPL